MKIKCPKCNASGNINDELIPDGGRSVKCPRCKNEFRIEKELPEVEVVEVERHDPTCSPTYDPTYHPMDGGDPTLEEDLFLFWWFF